MTAYRMMGNHDDASDVAQEAFVRAFRGLPDFDARSDFFTWLYRIAINVALNHLRRAGRRRRVSIDDAVLPDHLRSEASGDPSRALELKQMALDIGHALDQLSDAQRASIVLAVLEGLSYREVAEILECSEGTVAWRVHQARKQLRQQLGRYLAGSEDESSDGLSGDTSEAVDVRG
jgi:RNA polymerase sigma-70 factor (ECF subfamily)